MSNSPCKECGHNGSEMNECGTCGCPLPDRDDFIRTPVAEQPDEWSDKPDQWQSAIDAAHPTITGKHKTYEKALEMVSNRHSKGALVDLVNWLLAYRRPIEAGDIERLTDEEIKYMRNRFLGWKIPENFNPDGALNLMLRGPRNLIPITIDTSHTAQIFSMLNKQNG